MKTKKQIIQKRMELLEDTVKHFNSGNRSVGADKGITTPACLYSGKGCAIGRLIEDKELCAKLDGLKDDNGSFCTGVTDAEPFRLLPEGLKELGRQYLVDLQGLHDDPACWDDKGITELGERRAENMRIRWGV